jgi:hypothetical protein
MCIQAKTEYINMDVYQPSRAPLSWSNAGGFADKSRNDLPQLVKASDGTSEGKLYAIDSQVAYRNKVTPIDSNARN